MSFNEASKVVDIGGRGALEQVSTGQDWQIHSISARSLDQTGRKLLGDFRAQRTRYVGEVMQWLDFSDGSQDIDRYDHPDADTYYLIEEKTIDGERRSYAGLRLTPITDFDDALSLQMWGRPRNEVGSDISKQFVSSGVVHLLGQLKEEVKRPGGRNVYDITRLIPLLLVEGASGDLRTEALETHKAIVRLIGSVAGVAGLDSIVIFTSTPTFLRSLTKMGFPFDVIVRGQISADRSEEDSFLCWGYLDRGWYHVRGTRPLEAKLFEEGYRAIRGEGPDETLAKKQIEESN